MFSLTKYWIKNYSAKDIVCSNAGRVDNILYIGRTNLNAIK
jgi:hypothetical protein